MCIGTGQTSIIIAINIIYVKTVCSDLYKSNKTTCPCSEGLVIWVDRQCKMHLKNPEENYVWVCFIYLFLVMGRWCYFCWLESVFVKGVMSERWGLCMWIEWGRMEAKVCKWSAEGFISGREKNVGWDISISIHLSKRINGGTVRQSSYRKSYS